MNVFARAGCAWVALGALLIAQNPRPPIVPPGFGPRVQPASPNTAPPPEPKQAPQAAPQQAPAQGATAPVQPGAVAPPSPGGQVVYGGLSMHGASLREVVDMLARQLKINYIMDPRVNGSVTLNTYGELKDIDTKSLLDLLLRINGAAIVKTGELYRVVPLADLSRMPMPPQVTSKAGEIPPDDAPMLNLCS